MKKGGGFRFDTTRTKLSGTPEATSSPSRIFDGTVSAQLDAEAGGKEFRVLVFARDGKLLAQWTDVPSAKQLAAVLK
jgi:hypothetical protein